MTLKPHDFLEIVRARLPENATLEFITWTRQRPGDTAYTWSTGDFKLAWEAWRAGQASGRADVRGSVAAAVCDANKDTAALARKIDELLEETKA